VIAQMDDYEVGAFLLKGVARFLALLGGAMITFVPLVRWTVAAPPAEPRITDGIEVSQNFQWAQKLPLRRRFSSMPQWGLLAAFIFAFTEMAMTWPTIPPTPKGLRVHLLKPGEAPAKSDAWTEALIVRVEDKGPGKLPVLYVGSTRVDWDHLEPALKQELGRRKEWVVYVTGDEAVPWLNIAQIIDIARGDHAKVYLIDKRDMPVR
jgi:biopolymer transport protein ExbD